MFSPSNIHFEFRRERFFLSRIHRARRIRPHLCQGTSCRKGSCRSRRSRHCRVGRPLREAAMRNLIEALDASCGFAEGQRALVGILHGMMTLNQRAQCSSPCAPTNAFNDLLRSWLFIPTWRSAGIPTNRPHLFLRCLNSNC